MKCLSRANPADLSTGEFSVQRTNSKFAQVAVDHAIKQTMNHDTKSKKWIISFSTEPAVVHQWVVTTQEHVAITSTCLKLAHKEENSATHLHIDVRSSRVAYDDDVLHVIDTPSSWVNHFTQADQVNFSTGAIAWAPLKRDFFKAHSMGEKALSLFISERLKKKIVDLYKPVHMMQLRTISANAKTQMATNRTGRAAAMKTNCSLSSQMVIMTQARLFDMRTLFKHSLGPILWSLANADGSPTKTSKAMNAPSYDQGWSTTSWGSALWCCPNCRCHGLPAKPCQPRYRSDVCRVGITCISWPRIMP